MDALRRHIVVAVFALVGILLASSCLRSYRAPGSFGVDCRYSHSLADDPIVHHGHPGMSHLHDFYGNVSTAAASTYTSMRGADTTCRLGADTAGYWTPAAYVGGERVLPRRISVYYFGGEDAEPLPLDLRMISNPLDGTVRWTCGFRGSPSADHPFDCTEYVRGPGDGVTARLEFPSCWNGRGVQPDDVSYADGRSCTDEFDHEIPRVSVRVHYPILDPCLGARPCEPTGAPEGSIALEFSSGSYGTFHGDFWNTWDQRALSRLTRQCLNEYRECGKQP